MIVKVIMAIFTNYGIILAKTVVPSYLIKMLNNKLGTKKTKCEIGFATNNLFSTGFVCSSSAISRKKWNQRKKTVALSALKRWLFMPPRSHGIFLYQSIRGWLHLSRRFCLACSVIVYFIWCKM